MLSSMTTDKSIKATIEQFNEMTTIFANLADDNRQLIILALGRYDRLNVKQLAEIIPLSRPAISHHLKNLKQAGLIDHQKSGTENYYFLTLRKSVDNMRKLLDMIEQTCELR